MVKIFKGSQTMQVTKGAYTEMFKPSGWELVAHAKAAKADKQEQQVEDKEELSEETGATLSDDDLLEKPISSLSFDELLRLGVIMDIDTKGLKSKRELREHLKEHM